MRHALARVSVLVVLSSVALAQGPDLRLRFLFDEVSGTTLLDDSGNGHDGTYVGSPGLGQPGARPETGTSVDFDGGDDAAEVPNAADLMALTDDFSLVLWARIDNTPEYSPLFGNPNAWTLVAFGDTLRLQTTSQKLSVNYALPSGWNHIAVVFDASLLATFYVNGVSVGSIQGNSSAGVAQNEWLVATSPINSFPPDFTDGRLDDLQLYDGALDASEVQFLFDNPGEALGGSPGTVYCDESQNPNNTADIAISTIDSSSSSIDLLLTNGPPNQFCYLLVGNGNQTVSQPPGAKGDLCVVGGNCLGRYDKDVGSISGAGEFSTDILNAVSNPCAGGVTIAPGATWNFQFWHRQPMGQPATFSAALSVTFN